MIEEKLQPFASLSAMHEASYHFVLQVRDRLLTQYTKKEIEIEMLLTHLAMAYLRQLNNEDISQMCPDVRKEILEHSLYPEVINLWHTLSSLSSIEWQANEVDYIHAHLLALMIEE